LKIADFFCFTKDYLFQFMISVSCARIPNLQSPDGRNRMK